MGTATTQHSGSFLDWATMITRIDLTGAAWVSVDRDVLPRAAMSVEAATERVRPICEAVRQRGAAAVREITAELDGVALDLEETRATALAVYADTKGHRASLAVDLAEGRRTEIDAMCLEVARRGAAHGVPTPVNEVVGRLVRAREPR